MSDETVVFHYSVNQIVAWNLGRARQAKGWTQAEAVRQLGPYLGEEWSVATYSAAERSAERSDRIRQFSADDLVAFSAAFGVPVQYFFVPPWVWADDSDIAAGKRGSCTVFRFGEYMRVAFGSPAATESVLGDLQTAIEKTPVQWTDDDSRALRAAFEAFTRARVNVSRSELEEMTESLWRAHWFLESLLEAHQTAENEEPSRESTTPRENDDG